MTGRPGDARKAARFEIPRPARALGEMMANMQITAIDNYGVASAERSLE